MVSLARKILPSAVMGVLLATLLYGIGTVFAAINPILLADMPMILGALGLAAPVTVALCEDVNEVTG